MKVTLPLSLLLVWLSCAACGPAANAPAATPPPATSPPATPSPTAPSPTTAPATPAGCVGAVQRPKGARRLADKPPGYVIKPPGEGKLCAAEVFEAEEALTVYRVYDGTRPADPNKAAKMGGFWSLEPPRGKAQQYRVDNAICPVWNDLSRLVTCTMKPRTRFFVGTGQSVNQATCQAAISFEASAVNQVFIPYKEGTQQTPLDEAECKDEPMQWAP